MNEEIKDHARSLFSNGSSPTEIFTYLLAHEKPDESHLALVYSLQQIFHVSIPNLHMIGAWDRWKKDGYDDATLNKKLEGQLKLKEVVP